MMDELNKIGMSTDLPNIDESTQFFLLAKSEYDGQKAHDRKKINALFIVDTSNGNKMTNAFGTTEMTMSGLLSLRDKVMD